jgi:hypothetical protein
MKDYLLTCYIEDKTEHIIDELTEYYEFKANNDFDAGKKAETIWQLNSKLPFYGYCLVD